MTDNTTNEATMTQDNQEIQTFVPRRFEWPMVKAIFQMYFNDNHDCDRFHARLGDFSRFDGEHAFRIRVGIVDGALVWHPKRHEVTGEMWFSIDFRLVDWWHSSQQGSLAMNPRNCHGIGLARVTTRMKYIPSDPKDEGSEDLEGSSHLFLFTSKNEKMDLNSKWRFMPLNKRELCRGDLKGGHPRHRHDEHGRPMLSGHYAYGRRGYVTWGTSSLNEDGSTNYCRGLWYSQLSPMDWSEISYEMSKKTEDWLRVERGDWFCRRPMPQFYETMPNDIWDGLNRRMYSLWERMEGIYEEDHPVFNTEIQKIFGLTQKDKAS